MEAKFHTAIDSFGVGFDPVEVEMRTDYETKDRFEVVSSDIESFDLHDDDEESIPLGDFIVMLQSAWDNIPEKFRSSAVISMSCYGDFAHARLSVEYSVDEPEDVKAARLKAEEKKAAAAQERAALEAEARERAEFERLKAKFETGTK